VLRPVMWSLSTVKLIFIWNYSLKRNTLRIPLRGFVNSPLSLYQSCVYYNFQSSIQSQNVSLDHTLCDQLRLRKEREYKMIQHHISTVCSSSSSSFGWLRGCVCAYTSSRGSWGMVFLTYATWAPPCDDSSRMKNAIKLISDHSDLHCSNYSPLYTRSEGRRAANNWTGVICVAWYLRINVSWVCVYTSVA
jgi:hypothetical protein